MAAGRRGNAAGWSGPSSGAPGRPHRRSPRDSRPSCRSMRFPRCRLRPSALPVRPGAGSGRARSSPRGCSSAGWPTSGIWNVADGTSAAPRPCSRPAPWRRRPPSSVVAPLATAPGSKDCLRRPTGWEEQAAWAERTARKSPAAVYQALRMQFLRALEAGQGELALRLRSALETFRLQAAGRGAPARSRPAPSEEARRGRRRPGRAAPRGARGTPPAPRHRASGGARRRLGPVARRGGGPENGRRPPHRPRPAAGACSHLAALRRPGLRGGGSAARGARPRLRSAAGAPAGGRHDPPPGAADPGPGLPLRRLRLDARWAGQAP